ncbi:MAG: phage tail tape measure protein [Zoogloea sp.]|nr:phage tail tape measure protein [Zoogloea sp.]
MDTMRLKVELEAINKASGPLRDMLKGTTALSKGVKEARDKLRELNAQQKQLEGFREASARVTETGKAMQEAGRKVRELRDALVASETPTQNMKKEYQAAARELRNLTSAHERAKTAQTAAASDMQSAQIPVNELASRHANLAKQIDAANRSLDRQREQIERVKRVQTNWKTLQEYRGAALNVGTAATGTAAATGLPLINTIKTYADREAAVTELKGSMLRAGKILPPEFAQIQALAEKLGTTLPGTTTEFMEMMTVLNRQGMSAKAILGGLGEATALLAVQLKKPKAEAAEFAAKLQDATKTSEKDMLALMDTIQRTFYVGVDPQNMLGGFAKLSPALTILRKEGLEAAKALAPLLAMADQSGMTGETSGNAYRKILQMSIDAKKVGKGNSELAGTGIKLDFTNGAGGFGGLEKLFSELAKLKALGGNDAKRQGVLKTIFGDDAETLQALEILISKGKAGYDEMRGKMEVQASLNERVGESLGTLKNRWDALGGTFNDFSTKVGNLLEPAAGKVIELANSMVGGLSKFIDEYPGLSQVLVVGAALFAALAGGVGALALAAWAVTGPLGVLKAGFDILSVGKYLPALGTLGQTALPAIQGVLTAIATIAKGHPVLLLITTLAGAAALIWKNWDSIGPKLSEWWDRLGNFVSEKMRAIVEKLQALKRAFSFDFGPAAGGVALGAVGAKPLIGAGSSLVAPSKPLRPITGQPMNYSAPTTFNITAGPGQSPEDIARAVDRRLTERENQTASRRRSILADAQ